MTNIVVFTQNLKLDSFFKVKEKLESENVIFLTSHHLFENEKRYIQSTLNVKCIFFEFASFLSDTEMEDIDQKAFENSKNNIQKFLLNIRYIKNQTIASKICDTYKGTKGFLLSQNNDIGIADEIWIGAGFQKLDAEFYYNSCENRSKDKVTSFLSRIKPLKTIYHKLRNRIIPLYDKDEVFVAYKDSKKYIFIGKMHRIGYRMELEFENSQEECRKLNRGQYYRADECQYLTTLHESEKCRIPDKKKYDVRRIQDGYLPSNYLKEYYSFIPGNVKYYVWDTMGAKVFLEANLPVELMPFRKKLYMPVPIFPSAVNEILVVASGSGDWTALKNRSDDDLLVEAFVEIAKMYPQIHIRYRCHPSWVHPDNLGVNSIKRVAEYFDSLEAGNITISSNIPNAASQCGFQLSFTRSSLEEDLRNADIVFGEHSVSMIDAAFNKIPFCSVNMTNRRNFFDGMTKLGFPHCVSVEDISTTIKCILTEKYQTMYRKAVTNYNQMTEEDKL